MEYVVVAFLITVGIVVFHWVAQRMPVVYDHPDYKSSH